MPSVIRSVQTWVFLLSAMNMAASFDLKTDLLSKIREQFGYWECLYIHDGGAFSDLLLPPRGAANLPQVIVGAGGNVTTSDDFRKLISVSYRANCFVILANIDGTKDFLSYQNLLNSIRSEERMSVYFTEEIPDQLPICDFLAFETIVVTENLARYGKHARIQWIIC